MSGSRSLWTLADSTGHDRIVSLEARLRKLSSKHDYTGSGEFAPVTLSPQQIGITTLNLVQGLLAFNTTAWSGRPRHMIAYELQQLATSLRRALPDDMQYPDDVPEDLLAALEATANPDDIQGLLGVAHSATVASIGMLGELPLVDVDEAGQAAYGMILEALHVARQSKVAADKKAYLDKLCSLVLPSLTSDIAYFQAISFLVSYLHIDFPYKIPFTPTTFSLLSPRHRSLLSNTRYLQLHTTLMQTGGPHAGIRMRRWSGVNGRDEATGFDVFDCVGTNSDGNNRDAMMKQLGISTGSLANIDPRGIAYTAFNDLLAQYTTIVPKDPRSVIVNIGHSLGATIAAESFMAQKEMGVEDAYLLGFNGGAFNHDVPARTQEAAQTAAMLVQNRGDPVPYGGSHILPGRVRVHSSRFNGTIARSAPHSLLARLGPPYGNLPDGINHGVPNEIASVLLGVPGSYTLEQMNELEAGMLRRMYDLSRRYFPWLPDTLLTTVLRPDKSEKGKTDVTYIQKDFSK
ncbi:MAG: hypothetical protein EOO71_02105 [Myxococcaceae bacterium]|nr:MAG: hypothetical protein EOO71_02105 [Myxococcaceae bacterium]